MRQLEKKSSKIFDGVRGTFDEVKQKMVSSSQLQKAEQIKGAVLGSS